jgi:type I restriction enzyme R subunit
VNDTERLNEYTQVELPFIEQLKWLGWEHIEGDIDVPYLTERESFRDVLLKDRLRDAIRSINLDESGEPWLDEGRIREALGQIERLGAMKLMEANERATELLLKGVPVEADEERFAGREPTVHFIDYEHPERNDFLAINQFRVDVPGGQTFIIPDIVLFVNGIPVGVVECKSPKITDPLDEAIDQLLRYSNQRNWIDVDEGVERLFHYNQVMIGTYAYQAVAATVGAQPEHFLEWKDTSPVPMSEVTAELDVESLTSQQTLIAGMLRKEHLIDLIRNFSVFKHESGKTTKILAHYQQFRAVHAALHRLTHGQTRREHGESDQRGGVVWHTQGSGKSLTMVFLVRKMRMLPRLRRFKVVVVTDRIDLQKQLGDTAALAGETVRVAQSTKKLKSILREKGADLVFATIQKYHEREDVKSEVIEFSRADLRTESDILRDVDANRLVLDDVEFPVLNESEEIVVLVDEAHRSHTSTAHANLMKALPNCAKIAFTGTPIIMGKGKRTHEIFGEYIDRYTIKQSQEDGSTVKILYEGRTSKGEVADGRSLDKLFEDMFAERSKEELEAIKRKYATKGRVLEATKMIEAKADDILRHYVRNVLPNGFKAQLVAVSRLAAVRYHEALVEAYKRLLVELDELDPYLFELSDEELEEQPEYVQFLVKAHRHLEMIRRLEFAVVISGGTNDDPGWKTWTEKAQQLARIERFKKPLVHYDPDKQDSLAFLIVRTMLLTGFDAPVEQVMYLDRWMQGHELLQAIARVNRTHGNKTHGLVVDYYGIGHHLKEALAIYSEEDLEGVLPSIQDELPVLSDRHRRCLAIFHDHGIPDIKDVDDCVDLLRDVRLRADFVFKLKRFLESLDIVMPRPEALPYVRDAKILGFIAKAAENLYRDSRLNMRGAGQKVRELIDHHIESQGVNPKIPPIDILADEFEKAVDRHVSPKAKASEMEHAARYHIRKHYNEDPAHYAKLSERLENILKTLGDNWEELVRVLHQFVGQVREGRQGDDSGLDPRTQAPFLGVLEEEIVACPDKSQLRERPRTALAYNTVNIVEHIAQEIRVVDFWRNTQAQNVLRGWLLKYLDDNEIVPFERVQKAADRLVELAKHLHTRLTS